MVVTGRGSPEWRRPPGGGLPRAAARQSETAGMTTGVVVVSGGAAMTIREGAVHCVEGVSGHDSRMQ